jgi:formyltetrahydrofolate deformylase
MSHYRILIDSNDEKGLVYKISSIFFRHQLNILANNEFVDRVNNKFFMRSVVVGDADAEILHKELAELLPKDARVDVIAPAKKKIVLMATKESHALGDILIRYEAGELDAEILGVISNYDLLEPLVKKFDIPYFTVSHEGIGREEHEQKVLDLLGSFEAIDYIVLAKYMRILTPVFVDAYGTFCQ